MTFIDWSDSEGLFGLLVEFVADESNECVADSERSHFLEGLSEELATIERQLAALSAAEVIRALKAVREGVPHEFADDPVIVHVEACIEELERIEADGAA